MNLQAIVFGRVGADLYPLQTETPLERVRTFERFVGGFAGNVSTGLARLGVKVAILSAVGDDGHGRFVRGFLSGEGVDVTWLYVHPTLRTALAFCEVWPPDRFPITFYRTPTCPDWEVRPHDLPREALASVPLLYVTGTGLAREPSRSATFEALELRKRAKTAAAQPLLPASILDLDWRDSLWDSPGPYRAQIDRAVRFSDIVIGSASEFEAAGLDPEAALRYGARLSVIKRGPDGARVIGGPSDAVDVAGLPVPVVNGLGAGDAFASAFGAALLSGVPPADAARRANAAGAIVATRLSCSTAMPRSTEIDALLAGAKIVDGVVQPA
jgi:5-dehydro-2-deoxygluconokinase